jgi:hypothetical protein
VANGNGNQICDRVLQPMGAMNFCNHCRKAKGEHNTRPFRDVPAESPTDSASDRSHPMLNRILLTSGGHIERRSETARTGRVKIRSVDGRRQKQPLPRVSGTTSPPDRGIEQQGFR